MKAKKPDPRTTKTVDHHIADRIRARRLEIGMSQEALARTIGVTFQQVQKYEKGVNRVAASTLVAIARTLESNIAVFVPSEKDQGLIPTTLDHPGFAELSALYARLNASGQSLLMRTARALVAEEKLRK